MAKGKVKVRVIQPTIVAGAGGPAYAEGEVELDAEVAEAAEAMGGVEYIGKKPRKAAATKRSGVKRSGSRKTVAVRKRTAKTTEPAPAAGSGPMTKADVPGAS